MAALASWLDARAHGGRWLVRIEDVDRPRCVAGAAERILGQLAACGLHPDEPPWRQSTRDGAYRSALDSLRDAGLAYPCGCSRRDIEAAQGAGRVRDGERVYPGTCRHGLHGRPARAWRLRTDADRASAVFAGRPISPADSLGGGDTHIDWTDRRLGPQHQNLTREVGDFVLRRADGLWAYQLAVVVDDAAQGITDVVRGEDLADNTPRQIHLQRALGLPTPRYLHTPLVWAAPGVKLSKGHGAVAIDTAAPLAALRAAGATLGLELDARAGGAGEPDAGGPVGDWLAAATHAWAARWRQ